MRARVTTPLDSRLKSNCDFPRVPRVSWKILRAKRSCYTDFNSNIRSTAPREDVIKTNRELGRLITCEFNLVLMCVFSLIDQNKQFIRKWEK